MFVRSWMSSPVIALPVDTPAVDALELMLVKKIRRLPVLREGKLAGILTQSDLQAVLAGPENSPRRVRTRLGDLMTPQVRTVAPDDPLERAARLMLEHEISGLPVLEGDRLVGLITESDIFRAFTRIMGLWESGGRVVMTVPPRADLLREVASRTEGLAVRSLAAYPSSFGGWEVVVRIRGRIAAVPERSSS
jgi:acetoin utilization protein AcuB